jgi:hypothetical protein
MNKNESNKLMAEFNRLTDWVDMMVDEFKRIKACPGCNGEIAGICDRAIKETHQRVSVVAQRDAAVTEMSRLEGELVKATRESTGFQQRLNETLEQLEFDINPGSADAINGNESVIPRDVLNSNPNIEIVQ